LSSSVFIGLPCPMNSAGIRPIARSPVPTIGTPLCLGGSVETATEAPMPEEDRSSKVTQRAMIGAGIAAVTAGAAAAAFLFNRKFNQDQDDNPISDAPPWTLKQRPEDENGPLFGTTVTIGRPRDQIYAEWRDFTRFPRFMHNVENVERLDDKRSRWTIKAPAVSSVTLVTEIVDDVPGKQIGWKSTDESEIATTGEVLLKDAPGDRGTFVSLVQSYSPPAGTIGKLAGKLLQREPGEQARRDLRRFKQLMETGEVTTNASPSARKGEDPAQSHI